MGISLILAAVLLAVTTVATPPPTLSLAPTAPLGRALHAELLREGVASGSILKLSFAAPYVSVVVRPGDAGLADAGTFFFVKRENGGWSSLPTSSVDPHRQESQLRVDLDALLEHIDDAALHDITTGRAATYVLNQRFPASTSMSSKPGQHQTGFVGAVLGSKP